MRKIPLTVLSALHFMERSINRMIPTNTTLIASFTGNLNGYVFSTAWKTKVIMGDFTALWVLGYNPEMMRWRRVHYDMRSKLVGSRLNDPPKNFGPAKIDIQLTGGKQDGSSIWSSGDEDMMIILDRYVCVDDTRHVNPQKEEREHVYFQTEEVQGSPGYVYLKKCPLTKLDFNNSAMDRLVSSSFNENGYLSSQKWNRIIYDNCKTCEEQLKGLVENGINSFDEAVRDSCSYQWFETENDEYPNIIIRYKGFE